MATKSGRPPQPSTRSGASRDQTRTLILIAAVVAVVAVIGVVVALVVGGGDDSDDAVATVPMSGLLAACSNDVTAAGVEGSAPGDSIELAPYPADDIYKPVAVEGELLPPFSPEVRAGDEPDTALCRTAPIVAGYDYEGNETTIDPATDGPTMVVLLAHWCPHCNAEIPVLNEWRDSGAVPEGLHIVGVSTGASESAPNYPPDEWLTAMDWQWPVLVDDRAPDDESPPPAMGAYGGTSYPTLVFIDADGLVRQRLSGEVPIDLFAPIAEGVVADA